MGLDVERGPMAIVYVIIFVILGCVSIIICICLYVYRAGPEVRRGLVIDRYVSERGLRPSGTR